MTVMSALLWRNERTAGENPGIFHRGDALIEGVQAFVRGHDHSGRFQYFGTGCFRVDFPVLGKSCQCGIELNNCRVGAVGRVFHIRCVVVPFAVTLLLNHSTLKRMPKLCASLGM